MGTRNDGFEEYRKEYLENTPWRGSVNAKLDAAEPYHFFLTRIKDSHSTYGEDLSITFPELLDHSLGDLEHSLHINFMVELPWLLAQYAVTGRVNPSMTILYGVDDEDLGRPAKHLKLTAIRVKSPFPFGHHHTKMTIFFYKDKSLRFAIYTANLIESDWENRTQGVWVSPKCPYLGDEVPINYGESETLFKVDVLKYLNSYRQESIREWLVRIQQANLSKIKVCFVASVPGLDKTSSYGHPKLSKLIKENVTGDFSNWKLVAQCSSIGSLGNSPESWLFGDFARSLSETKIFGTYPVQVIYPSFNNVRQSLDGMAGGGCLPYQSSTHFKQLWLRKYLNQWKSDHRYRSKAVPHIKSYMKMAPDGKKIAWFLLTSANLSKAAWGQTTKEGVRPMSYEAGVLFLPRFTIGKNLFNVKKGGDTSGNKEEFPVPYDTPLTPYEDVDKIFLYDKCFNE